MDEILHAFGINWKLIAVQMFNFALLFAALSYFLYTPVLKLLRERTAIIKKGVDDAAVAAELKSKAQKEHGELLKEARLEAEVLGRQAVKHAEITKATIMTEAEDRAAKIIIAAKERAEEVRAAALKASEAEVAEAAILAAEHILLARQK